MQKNDLPPSFSPEEDVDELAEFPELECHMCAEAEMEDFEEICAMDELMAGQPERQMMVSLAIRAGTCKVIANNGVILAYGICDYGDAKEARIRLVHVREDRRGEGIGSDLLTHFESMCDRPRIYGMVPVGNAAAEKMMRAAGYRPSSGGSTREGTLFVKSLGGGSGWARAAWR